MEPARFVETYVPAAPLCSVVLSSCLLVLLLLPCPCAVFVLRFVVALGSYHICIPFLPLDRPLGPLRVVFCLSVVPASKTLRNSLLLKALSRPCAPSVICLSGPCVVVFFLAVFGTLQYSTVQLSTAQHSSAQLGAGLSCLETVVSICMLASTMPSVRGCAASSKYVRRPLFIILMTRINSNGPACLPTSHSPSHGLFLFRTMRHTRTEPGGPGEQQGA